MNCPSCGLEIVTPMGHTNPDKDTVILEIEDVVYNRERFVTGVVGNNIITTHNYKHLNNDDVIGLIYQCKNCGAELPIETVKQAVKEWRR